MMIKGTTPTLTLTLPEEVDLEQASHVFITFANKDNKRLLELQADHIVDCVYSTDQKLT